MRKVREIFDKFKDFNTYFHAKILNQNDGLGPTSDSLYWDGQFDEIPYIIWEENLEYEEIQDGNGL